jgi:CRISPR-associated protein Cmr3
MTTIILHPTDTVFFRDGRPYNQGDPTQAEAASVFPPHPPTVVGAVRAAVARALGWSGGAWDDAMRDRLGDGVDWQQGDAQLGRLRFRGPYVYLLKNPHKSSHRPEPLFPAPLCLVTRQGDGDENIFGQLAPGQAVECDLDGRDKVRLPVMPGEGWKVVGRTWLTADGMTRVLNEENPGRSEVFNPSDLWRPEPRVGIQRHTDTRTTGRFEARDGEPPKGALFAASHVRLAKDVALAVVVAGLEGLPAAGLGGNLAPLGGEGRSAWIEQRDEEFPTPKAPDLRPGEDGVLRYTASLVTPADVGRDWPSTGGRLVGSDGKALPGHVVSACTGRAIAVGGWDSAARRPLPLRPLVPAGSTWFLEADADEKETIQSWHGRAIGKSAGWGFGHVLIGRWEPARGEA